MTLAARLRLARQRAAALSLLWRMQRALEARVSSYDAYVEADLSHLADDIAGLKLLVRACAEYRRAP